MSELQATAGCSKACLNSEVENCVNGWLDGSCGALPRGTQWPKDARAKQDERIKEIHKTVEIVKSGYAGILSNGNIVDRREHPEALPIPENKMLGAPKPKTLPNE